MKSAGRGLAGLVLLVCAVFFVSGCATCTKIPIKLDPYFSQRNIDTIVLMPIVDRRVDKKSSIHLENEVRRPIKKILERKGYTVVTPSGYSPTMSVSGDQVAEMKASELAMLGPQDGRALLFVYVEDVMDSYVVLAYTFKIEATGSLIDKSDRTEIWRDKGIGASGQGGLISGVVSGFDRAEAITQCVNNMMVTLPKKPTPTDSRQQLVSGGASAMGASQMAPAAAVSTGR